MGFLCPEPGHCQPDRVMSQDIGNCPDLQLWVRQWSFLGLFGGSVWCSGGLVVDAGFDGEFADEFSGDGVHDADLRGLG